jgi:two-component system response regulator RegA
MGVRRSIRRVLIVDDDESVLGAWKRNVSRERHVVTATNTNSALQLAHEHHADLAVVDLRLGNESGLDLIRELKQQHPGLLIVLCSGYLSVSIAVAAIRAGAELVVFKPITFNEILRRIEHESDEPDLEDTPTLARAEWEHITRVLADCNGNVSKAARRLGIFRTSLQRRLRKYAPRS